jgi:hypothetical protein
MRMHRDGGYGAAMNPLDRAWNDPDLWKKG